MAKPDALKTFYEKENIDFFLIFLLIVMKSFHDVNIFNKLNVNHV